MALILKAKAVFSSKTISGFYPLIVRALSTSKADQNSEGWLSKLLHVRKIDPGKDSHSRLLSDSDSVYELQIHDVKPDSMEPYLQGYEQWVQVLQEKCKTTELVGSWRVEIGDQDQVVHIWRHNGYTNANEIFKLCDTDHDLKNLHQERVNYLRARQNQIMLAFSYWGHAQPAVRNCKYEMRSYILKPGTMIEWANNWARGINFRKAHAVAGYFSQIGQLYMVHHIWGYPDLQKRKEYREEAWRKPGWDECVAYTVPLIREMRSRWLTPNSFSPIK
ncbi:protein NipSnap-like [Tachypleus tridentatus]|uniref:protein NipSnap-like n=1 Tax=Tachypleus tridentatus TaxID=6853 RepID=UPI003FD1CE1E